MIGAPLAVWLMVRFSSETSNGVVATFLVMGVLYLCVMLIGAWLVRVPAAEWRPAGFVPQPKAKLITAHDVHADLAASTPQFYLLWLMLCLNVTAGIGILGKASDMLQDMFGVSVTAGSTFVGLLSLSNMVGRFVWSTCLGRTWSSRDAGCNPSLVSVHFGIPFCPARGGGAQTAFVSVCCIIMTMYGGGFATIPAYLRDLFGTLHVGAIHGRLLTAWSIAGVAGPVLLMCWAERQKQAGIERSETYNGVLMFMAGFHPSLDY